MLIPVEKRELKEALNSKEMNKQPAPYPKGEKKRHFSSEVEEGSLLALKHLLSKHKNEEDIGQIAAPPPSLVLHPEIIATSQLVAKIEPSGQVMDLYGKLIDTLVMVNRKGIQETTFFLDGDAFQTSVFQGAKITITEYSTAPKVFNIEFSAKLQSVNFFERHAGDLLAALQKDHFGFSVNRIDSSLLSEDERHAIRKVERDLEKEDHS